MPAIQTARLVGDVDCYFALWRNINHSVNPFITVVFIGRDLQIINAEFNAPVRVINLSEFTEQAPSGVAYETELTAATGVFA